MDGEGNALHTIDLNGDVGEGFGPYVMATDPDLLDCVSSASIACGFHAGDPGTMRRTVRLALEKGVAIGAHPGLPDRMGFGRRAMEIAPDEAYEMTLYQIGALDAFVKAEGGRMAHVKPHGALYNMAAQDPLLARSIAEAVYDYDPHLILFGLSGSELIRAGESLGLRTANEVFADRRYLNDGRLSPRRNPGSVITEVEEAVAQTLRLVREKAVVSLEGDLLRLEADTLCIHGDTPHAVRFARTIRDRLLQQGIRIRPVPPLPSYDSSG